MISELLRRAASLDWMQVVAWGFLLMFAMELLTVGLRFGCGLQSRRHTRFVSPITCGLRVHHGYFGILLAAIAVCVWQVSPGVRNLLLMFAFGLVASDLVHHFLVLWSVTGSPEFDLTYPKASGPPPK